MSFDPYKPPKALLADISPTSVSESSDKISLSELEAFTGKGSYPGKINSYLNHGKWHGGFNYWAAVFGVNWFVFRKLYLSALTALSIEAGIPLLIGFCIGFFKLLEKSSATIVVIIAAVLARICVGMFANIALAWKAEAVIQKTDKLNLANKEHLKRISQAGEVSVIALLIAYVAIGLIRQFSRGL